LSESRVEDVERGVTDAALLAQNDDLREQLSLAQESIRTLTTSLAESNAEAELFRRKFSDLQLRMEALGLESASKDRAKLEQRLLTAVSDLQLAEKERDAFRDQMLRLNETMVRYLKTSQGPIRRREWMWKRNCEARMTWWPAGKRNRQLQVSPG